MSIGSQISCSQCFVFTVLSISMVKLVFGLSRRWLGYFAVWSLFGLSYSVDESFRGVIIKKAGFFSKNILNGLVLGFLGYKSTIHVLIPVIYDRLMHLELYR